MAAPTFVDSIPFTFANAAADPQVLTTTGLDWTAGQRIISVFGSSGSITTAVPAGATDDTSSLLATRGANSASLYEHEIIPQGGALDATLSYNLSGSRRAVAVLATYAGVDSITTPVRNEGVSVGAPVSSSFVVTGGPRDITVLATANSTGGHDTNPPQAPSGYTLRNQAANGAAETTSSLNTAALAERTYLIADLTWVDGSATVPAATWLGWTDIGAMAWETGHFALQDVATVSVFFPPFPRRSNTKLRM